MASSAFFFSGDLKVSDRYITRSQRTICMSKVTDVFHAHDYSHLATQKTANMIFSLTVFVSFFFALCGRAFLVCTAGDITFLAGLGLALLACGLTTCSCFLIDHYIRTAQLQRQNEISVSVRMRDGSVIPIETMPAGYGEEARQLVRAVRDAMTDQVSKGK